MRTAQTGVRVSAHHGKVWVQAATFNSGVKSFGGAKSERRVRRLIAKAQRWHDKTKAAEDLAERLAVHLGATDEPPRPTQPNPKALAPKGLAAA